MNLIKKSRSSKTLGIAVTYHYERGAAFATCPPTCSLMPADVTAEAAVRYRQGIPTVVDVPPGTDNRFKFAGVEFRACPATLASHINCGNCGGGTDRRPRAPICAQPDRDYVVTFPWHGPPHVLAAAVKSGAARCYGADGRVGMQWRALANKVGRHGILRGPIKYRESDLEPWAATLGPGTRLRHHVVGDLGRAK